MTEDVAIRDLFALESESPPLPPKECPSCEHAKNNRYSGAYHFSCLACCTRLVLSTHPNKELDQSMLGAIERFPEAPKREEIIASLKKSLGTRAKN